MNEFDYEKDGSIHIDEIRDFTFKYSVTESLL